MELNSENPSKTSSASKPPIKNPARVLHKKVPLTTKKAVELLLGGTLKNKVCRYCLSISHPLSELDQILQIGGQGALYKVTIRDMVASFHPFKVMDDPNFPNKICNKCLTRATRSYLFAQQCEQAERALRNCMEDMFEKLEKLDPIERTKKRGRQKLNPNRNVLHAEHNLVMDYAEPIRNLINVGSVSLTKETEITDLECKRCWQVLPNVESLVNHEKMHPKSMWYHCRLCGKSFIKRFQMKRHLKYNHKHKDLLLPQEEEKGFACKECYHVSNTYELHLQHVEKHKFQTVFEHLVERNMDRLCAVCLDKGDLVELEKIICLHGGYPELTGDRSVYNILGSTVPERKSYKYQELFVPCKANVMTITKRTNQETQELAWNQSITRFSGPVIISSDNESFEDVYLFIFPEPQSLNEEYLNIVYLEEDQILPSIEEYNSTNATDENSCYTEMLPVPSTVNNIDDDILLSGSKDDTNNNILPNGSNNINILTVLSSEDTNKLTFSFPGFEIHRHLDMNGCNYEQKINMEKKLCNDKHICNECLGSKSNITEADHSHAIDKTKYDNVQEPCKFCWVFKHTEKCDHCQKSNLIFHKTNANEASLVSLETKSVENDDFNVVNNTSLEANKRNATIENDVIKPKRTKWECNICLIRNDMNREICVCCDANKSDGNSKFIRINFHHNSFFDYANKVNNEKTAAPEIALHDKNDEVLINSSQQSLQNTMVATEMEYSWTNTSATELSIMHFDNPVADPTNTVESMDIVTTENAMHNLSIFNNQPNSAFNPTPFIFNSSYPSYTQCPTPNTQPRFQFALGSGEARTKNTRRLMRPIRRMATAFHK